MNIKELHAAIANFSGYDEVRVLPIVKDDDGEIIIDDCKSKPILKLWVWKGEIVLLYEEDEECM